jgi:hypothetical protein
MPCPAYDAQAPPLVARSLGYGAFPPRRRRPGTLRDDVITSGGRNAAPRPKQPAPLRRCDAAAARYAPARPTGVRVTSDRQPGPARQCLSHGLASAARSPQPNACRPLVLVASMRHAPHPRAATMRGKQGHSADPRPAGVLSPHGPMAGPRDISTRGAIILGRRSSPMGRGVTHPAAPGAPQIRSVRPSGSWPVAGSGCGAQSIVSPDRLPICGGGVIRLSLARCSDSLDASLSSRASVWPAPQPVAARALI